MAQIAAGQWGLIRSDQAVAAGVRHSQLGFLVRRGLLTRVQRGIYLMPGAERHRLEAVRAAWLHIGPEACALADTAIFVHGYTCGLQGNMKFASPKRFQGRLPGVIVQTRKMHPDAWEIRDGIRTQKLEYAIVDCWSESNSAQLVGIAHAAGIEYWDFLNIKYNAVAVPLMLHVMVDQMRPSFRKLYVGRARRIYPPAFECDCELDEDLGERPTQNREIDRVQRLRRGYPGGIWPG